jgi:bifunctional non-homologous end joining protein LigD
VTSFEIMQQVSDSGGGHLTYFAFDLLHLDGEMLRGCHWWSARRAWRRFSGSRRQASLIAITKAAMAKPFAGRHASMVSKASSRSGSTAPIYPAIAARGLKASASGAWVKSKCLNRAEFVIVGWSDPEGARPLLGALLLGYYESDGRLIYAGRVGTGMPVETLVMLHERLRSLAIKTIPLAQAPPRKQRFGSALALSKVHWVRPELVAEITYLSWSDDGLPPHRFPRPPRRQACEGSSARSAERAMSESTEQ